MLLIHTLFDMFDNKTSNNMDEATRFFGMRKNIDLIIK